MSELIGDIFPVPYPGKREGEAASETTSGGSNSTRWVIVATQLNPGEAIIIKARLESYQIPALVQQEAIGSVLGLTVGPLGSARVLVPEPLAERALAILAETFEIGEEGEDEVED